MSKHTPGPWMRTQGGNIAEWPSNYSQQDLADARLIAAAPDLLDACEAAIQIAHNSTCPFGRKYAPKNHPCDCNYHAFYQSIRSALLKSKGP